MTTDTKRNIIWLLIGIAFLIVAPGQLALVGAAIIIGASLAGLARPLVESEEEG